MVTRFMFPEDRSELSLGVSRGVIHLKWSIFAYLSLSQTMASQISAIVGANGLRPLPNVASPIFDGPPESKRRPFLVFLPLPAVAAS